MDEVEKPLISGARVFWPEGIFGCALLVAGILPILLLSLLLGPVWAWWPRSPTLVELLPLLFFAIAPSFGMASLWRYFALRRRGEQYALTSVALLRRRRGQAEWEQLIEVSRIRRVQAGGNPNWDGTTRAAPLWIVDDHHGSLHIGPVPAADRWVQLIADLQAARGIPVEACVQPWVRKRQARAPRGRG